MTEGLMEGLTEGLMEGPTDIVMVLTAHLDFAIDELKRGHLMLDKLQCG